MMFEEQIYRERREGLRRRMRSGIVLLLGNVSSPVNYPNNAYRFRQDSSFLYYFGLDKPGLVGIIDIEGGRDVLYGDDLTMDDIVWTGPQPTIRELGLRVGVQSTRPYRDVAVDLAAGIKAGRDVHFLPPYRGAQKLTLASWLSIYPTRLEQYASSELVSAVIAQRAVKQECELRALDEANAIGYQMHVTAMRMAQPGQREQVIAGMLEGVACSAGRMTSFSTILSQHGETLHNEDHSGVLERGKLLLVDCGAESNMYYASDNTRTIPVGGKFTDRQRAIYELVLEALETGIKLSKPGVRYLDVHLEACRVLTRGLQGLGIMQGDVEESVASGAHALFLPHGLGHMIGLDVHDMENLGESLVGYDQETPRVDQFGTASLRCGRRLQEGFCISVEPGIYFIPALIEKWKRESINTRFINHGELEKYIGFGGIRLEETIAITSDGCRLLGEQRIPITVSEVEAEVAKGARS